jgi:hypothetical protein
VEPHELPAQPHEWRIAIVGVEDHVWFKDQWMVTS